MKLILSISLAFFSVFAVGQSHVNVIVIDGYTNLPLDNCAITITKKQKPFAEVTTTSEGILQLSKRKLKGLCIEINNDPQLFVRHYIRRYKKVPDTILVHMIPTLRYEQKMFAIEDEKYGVPLSKKGIHKTDTLTSENDSLFVDAVFGNSTNDMQRFIAMNVEYPEISRLLGDQGIVSIEFIVEKDGAITHVETLRSVTGELDDEAKRVIRSMRYWTPAEYDGQKVRTHCTVPIRFVLD